MRGASGRVIWQTHRMHGHGVFMESIDALEMEADAIVTASITELKVSKERGEIPHIGSAHMSILNITPQTNSVWVRCHVAWGSPLLLRISLMWINP